MVLMSLIIQVLHKHLIVEIEICNSFSSSIFTDTSIHSVWEFAYGLLSVLHQVASQSSSLVREYVIHLAKLLVQVRSLHFGCQVLGLIVNLNIPLDELSLDKLHNFKRHYQRDWDEVTIRFLLFILSYASSKSHVPNLVMLSQMRSWTKSLLGVSEALSPR